MFSKFRKMLTWENVTPKNKINRAIHFIKPIFFLNIITLKIAVVNILS